MSTSLPRALSSLAHIKKKKIIKLSSHFCSFVCTFAFMVNNDRKKSYKISLRIALFGISCSKHKTIYRPTKRKIERAKNRIFRTKWLPNCIYAVKLIILYVYKYLMYTLRIVECLFLRSFSILDYIFNFYRELNDGM